MTLGWALAAWALISMVLVVTVSLLVIRLVRVIGRLDAITAKCDDIQANLQLQAERGVG